MEVTSVRRVRKRCLITLGSETLRIPADVYDERPLLPGDEIDPEEYDQWLLVRQFRPALNYAVSLLAQRPFAEKELEQRMRRIGYRPVTCELVIYKLNKYHLLNDREFARQWAASRVSRKLGPARIALELRRKGVSPEDSEEALAALDGETVDGQALAVARKGFASARPGEDPRKTAQRVTAMLVRRGFSFEQARQAIRQLREEAGDNDRTGAEP
ncbi:MAG: regulatory protein RecX [Clostridia bacterium]|nr:regulatory protein RecX [Clostridia bacterium]